MDTQQDHNQSFVENIAATIISSVDVNQSDVVASLNEQQLLDTPHSATYRSRTMRPNSINSQRRAELLPAYPLDRDSSRDKTLLLLSNVLNVDRDECEKESFCGGNGICPFEFKQYRYVASIDSFMMDLFQELFVETSQRWKINYALIDYNMTRLRTCMDIYRKQTGEPAIICFQELSIALEFYMQIDVDLFFMKTCRFRGAKPRQITLDNTKDDSTEIESILCQLKPNASYDMTPCYKRDCSLCALRLHGNNCRGISNKNSLQVGVEFCSNQIHQFVNKYEAILNCPASCTTTNVIYALSCPCGKYDYIGSTGGTFYDRIIKYRSESNRIIREFLIGIYNMHHILRNENLTDERLINNDMHLYQHSSRCSMVMQHFLNNNPEYWCLVPMSSEEARQDDKLNPTTASSDAAHIGAVGFNRMPLESPTFAPAKTQLFQEVLRNTTRSREECVWLAKGLPKTPTGFRFSRRQIDEQLDFFKFKKDTSVLSRHLIDCYKYTIIAVLPDECSYELRRFIESLFITHCETKLNPQGNLTRRTSMSSTSATITTTKTAYDHTNRGHWCNKLIRHTTNARKF